MRLTKTAAAALVIAVLVFAQMPDRDEMAFHAAMKKETLDGDLKSAIEGYQKLTRVRDRAIAARALVRIGECYERLGNTEAQKAYERVVRDFSEQKAAVEAARARLTALGAGSSSGSRLTRLPVSDGWFAAASPDGQRMLLQRSGELILRDVQTGKHRTIAKSTWGGGAAFSPDGRQVLFFRRDNDVLDLKAVETNGLGERSLWRGGPLRNAWAVTLPQDGKQIFFRVSTADRRTRLLSVPVTGGPDTTIWEGQPTAYTRVSPDGRTVAYTRTAGTEPAHDELWLLNVENRKHTLLFQEYGRLESPVWTPDGNGILYLTDRRMPGAVVDLWHLPVSGGKAVGLPQMLKADMGQVANGWAQVWAIGQMTRNGVYHFHRDNPENLRMRQLLTAQFNPDTGKVVGMSTWVSRRGGESRTPSFSRDGRWLAYISQNRHLVVQDTRSGEERAVPLNPGPTAVEWAVMIPDGQSVIMAATNPKDGVGLFRIDVATGRWTLLKKERAGFPFATSPDGRTVYLTRTNEGVMRHFSYEIETGQERELTAAKDGRVGALSPDGKLLAITRAEGSGTVIEVLPATGGPRREVHRVQGIKKLAIAWTHDARYIVYNPFDGVSDGKGYFRVPVAGGEAQPIGISAAEEAVEFPRGFGLLVFHPNGRQVVYTALGESRQICEDWVLKNFLPGLKKPN